MPKWLRLALIGSFQLTSAITVISLLLVWNDALLGLKVGLYLSAHAVAIYFLGVYAIYDEDSDPSSTNQE